MRFLLPLLLSLPALAVAQGDLLHGPVGSAWTYRYALSPDEVRAWLTDSLRFELAGQVPVDSFPADSPWRAAPLPPGYYLHSRAEGARETRSLEAVYRWHLELLHNERDFAALVLDSLGQALDSAHLRFDGRTVPFDARTQAYRLPKGHRRGILEVEAGGHTDFYRLDDSRGRVTLRRLGRRLWYSPPLRWLWRPPYRFVADVRQSLRYRNATGWVGKVAGWFQPAPVQATFLLNQPQYRPGDTLRWKAILLRKQKALPQEQLVLLLQGPGRTLVLDTLTAYRPGAWTGSLVLHDSLRLRLDSRHTLSLRPLTKDRYLASTSFLLADYELSEVHFDTRTSGEAQVPGQPLRLFAQATDQNQLNLPAARLTLYVTNQQVQQAHQNGTFVPDTLWVHEQLLDPRGETQVVLPDSIFPPASLTYQVLAVLHTAEGERREGRHTIRYTYPAERLELTAGPDSLIARYTYAGRVQPRRGWLEVLYPGGHSRGDSVDLPLARQPDPRVERYALRVDTLATAVAVSPAHLHVSGRWQGDSVHLTVDNPLDLPLHYYLFRGKKLVQRGYGQLPAYLPGQGSKPWGLSVHYYSAGQVRRRDYRLDPSGKQLLIEVEGPEQVYPGQEATYAVRLTDEEGRPVAEADLSAYALTASFPGYAPPKLPQAPVKYKTGRKRYNRFETETLIGPEYPRLDYAYWRSRFGLDSLAFYRFTRPDSGIARRSWRAPDSLTQIAPFVFAQGEQLPAHIIYLNEVPVYFSFARGSGSYSFSAPAGYNEVVLRTAEYEVRLDSVWVPQGHKLLLVADLYGYHPHKSVLRKTPQLSEAEQARIQPYLFPLHTVFPAGEGFILQGNTLFPVEGTLRYRYERPELFGPVRPGTFRYERLGIFAFELNHEPGFTYEFSEKLVKMRSYEVQAPEALSQPNRTPQAGTAAARRWQAQGRDSLRTADQLRAEWLAREQATQLRKRYEVPSRTTPGFGSLHLRLADSLRFEEGQLSGRSIPLRRHPGQDRTFYQLPAGWYQYRGWLNDSTFFQLDSLWVRANGHTYYTGREGRIIPVDSSLRAAYLRLPTVAITNPMPAASPATTPIPDTFTGIAEGYVRDEMGAPLPGATVLVKGTQVGTFTDLEGYYRLRVPPNGILLIQYIGYESREMELRTSLGGDIALRASETMLEEVVVVGRKAGDDRYMLEAETRQALTGQVIGIPIRDLALPDLYDVEPTQPEPQPWQETGENYRFLEPPPGMPALQASLRTDFRDAAFWRPDLRTDARGEARLTVRFPDDVTRWRSFFHAWDPQSGRTGQAERSIRAYKPLLAQLALPRFLVAGDSATVVTKAQNYGDDSMQVALSLRLGDRLLWEKNTGLRYSQVDTLPLIAPAGRDSVSLTFRLDRPADGYYDGESRDLPLYPRGDRETAGYFAVLSRDSAVSWTFDRRAEVQLSAQASLLDLAGDEIGYLHRYPYGCHEQLASKLKAFVLARRIDSLLGREDQWSGPIREQVRRLEKGRNEEGLWGWWPGGRSSDWISLHVLEALQAAQAAGFAVDLDEASLRQRLLLDAFTDTSVVSLRRLWLLHRLGSPARLDTLIEKLENRRYVSLEEKLSLIHLRQVRGLPYALDSVWHYRKESLYGGSFWPGERYHVWRGDIETTLQAYAILQAAGGQAAELQRIEQWLLRQRQRTGYWPHTYASARVLEVLLPPLLGPGGELPAPPALELESSGQLIRVDSFPFRATLPPGSRLTARNASALPVFFGAYQQWHEPEAPATGTDFRLHRWWGDDSTAQSRHLPAGLPVKVRVAVTVARAAEYVLIEIPIPGGCSYHERRDPRGPGEVHREYRRDRVALFCERLPVGTHVYEVEVLPRYPGRYTLNPARAEEMYFPVFFGRTAGSGVVVE